MERIDKPWGYEEIIDSNQFYIIKSLVVFPVQRLSKQYHNLKTETIIPINGIGSILINNKPVQFIRDVYYYKPIPIKPKIIHRICGGTDSDELAIFLEVSTPELNDVVRIEDDYGRV